MCIRAACHSCVSGTSRRSPGQRNATLRRGYGQGDVTTERALYGCWSLQDGQCLHCVWTAAQLTAGGARSRRAAGYNRAAAACTGAGIRKWAICELAPALSPAWPFRGGPGPPVSAAAAAGPSMACMCSVSRRARCRLSSAARRAAPSSGCGAVARAGRGVRRRDATARRRARPCRLACSC